MQYQTILLDPPWPYDRTHGQGIAGKEYSLMTWNDIHALGDLIRAVALPNCAILCWVTAPLLIEQTDTIRRWGFRYITKAYCWVKTTRNGAIWHGIGSYTASNTEDVWLLSNGTPIRHGAIASQVVPTSETIIAARSIHSRKPDAIHRAIEQRFPGPYLELFARRQRAGWTCVGNEIDGRDIREALALEAAKPQALEAPHYHEQTVML